MMDSIEKCPTCGSRKKSIRLVMIPAGACEDYWHDGGTFQLEALAEVKARGGLVDFGSARVYAVASESDEMDFHYVIWLDGAQEPVCHCKGFRFRDTCRHVKQVLGLTGQPHA